MWGASYFSANDGPDHQGDEKKLGEVGLTVKPSKCQLAMSECTYLGHVVGSGVVKPVASKL